MTAALGCCRCCCCCCRQGGRAGERFVLHRGQDRGRGHRKETTPAPVAHPKGKGKGKGPSRPGYREYREHIQKLLSVGKGNRSFVRLSVSPSLVRPANRNKRVDPFDKAGFAADCAASSAAAPSEFPICDVRVPPAGVAAPSEFPICDVRVPSTTAAAAATPSEFPNHDVMVPPAAALHLVRRHGAQHDIMQQARRPFRQGRVRRRLRRFKRLRLPVNFVTKLT
jgi:hypothetical protein